MWHTVNSETEVRPNNDYYFPSGLQQQKQETQGPLSKATLNKNR